MRKAILRSVGVVALAWAALALTPASSAEAWAEGEGWRWLNAVGRCPDPCAPPSWCNRTVPDDD